MDFLSFFLSLNLCPSFPLPFILFSFLFFLSLFSLIFPSFLSFAFFLPVIFLWFPSVFPSFLYFHPTVFLSFSPSFLFIFHVFPPFLLFLFLLDGNIKWKLGLDHWNYKRGGGGPVGPGCVFLYFYLHVTFDLSCGTHGRLKLGCARYLTKEYPYPSEIHRSFPLHWPWCDLMWPSRDLSLFLGFGWQHLRL